MPTQTVPPLGIQRCRDCQAEEGSFHDFFCTKERCPFCFGQLASCDCIRTVLKLSPEECTTVDEYVDDFVEPLKSIVARWRRALEAEGRLRFVFAPNLCRRCGKVDPELFRVEEAEWRKVIPANLSEAIFCKACYSFLRDRLAAPKR